MPPFSLKIPSNEKDVEKIAVFFIRPYVGRFNGRGYHVDLMVKPISLVRS